MACIHISKDESSVVVKILSWQLQSQTKKIPIYDDHEYDKGLCSAKMYMISLSCHRLGTITAPHQS